MTYEAQLEALFAIDPWERGHSERVAVYATAAAFACGFRGDTLRHLRIAAELHNTGKAVCQRLGYPQEQHPKYGALGFHDEVQTAVHGHHERLDGSGYPGGLSGAGVSLLAQLVGAAEWLDLALNGSPESEPRDPEEVRAELRAQTSVWFSAEVIEALLEAQRVIQPVGT